VSARAPIRPDARGLEAVFWEGVQREQVLLQRCARCRQARHPPSELCGTCGSERFEWEQASGAGVIHSFTIVHHAVHPAVAAWVPYTLLLVELAEGPRLVGRLLDGAVPAIEAPVRLGFDRYSDLLIPAFSLADVDGPRGRGRPDGVAREQTRRCDAPR
jgi:uncharacterized OB-fold protein